MMTTMAACMLTLSLALPVGAQPAAAERPMPGASDSARRPFKREDPFITRPFQTVVEGRWIGNAIAYSPYRDGQRPGGRVPSREQLLEDLRIISKRWRMLRVYSALEPTPRMLSLIKSERLPLKVMLGVWIAPESRKTPSHEIAGTAIEAARSNRAEVESAIHLAAKFPETIVAISVGNETQVSWSSHRVDPEILIDYIRQIRIATNVPVTTADDFSFWILPESVPMAQELDFIAMHVHPMWNSQPLDGALAFTEKTFTEVSGRHPKRQVVITECGWATMKHTEGEQARLITGHASEAQQARFFAEFTAWCERKRITSFFFEAFDENWKGGDHPNEVEKHWGLFRSDRAPKKAVR